MQFRHSLKYIVSPILCASFCSTQLLQQFLVAFIQRQHTANDRNTVNHIPEKEKDLRVAQTSNFCKELLVLG